MPRIKPNQVTPVATREECDKALARIGAINRALSTLDGELNMVVDKAKTAVAASAAPMKEEKKKLENGIEAFARLNREELLPARAKSVDLPHGSLSFRWTSWIVITKNTIALLIRRKRKDCIITKESVDKDALAKWDDEDLAKVEAHREREDVFGYVASEQVVARQPS